MFWFNILIFIFSCGLLFWSGSFLVSSLARIAKFLGWKEFVVAFFIMAVASSFPNLFIGFFSALHGIPELSFGDIVGGNLIDLTVGVALAALVAKNGLPSKSQTAQATALFTISAAVLPLLLILDKNLDRADGIILISFFSIFVFWIFSKKERFKKIYDGDDVPPVKGFTVFIKDVGRVAIGIAVLLLAAQGIVKSAFFFAETFNISIPLIGILIIGLGNALPEVYFAIISAKKGETGMILGNLMGSIIVPATLVLGIVALICPIEISDFSPFVIARIFLIIACLLFFIFIKTNKTISRKEAIVLFAIYFSFVAAEIAAKGLFG